VAYSWTFLFDSSLVVLFPIASLMLRITFPLLSAVDAEIVDKLHFGGFESKKGGPSSEGAADVSTSFSSLNLAPSRNLLGQSWRGVGFLRVHHMDVDRPVGELFQKDKSWSSSAQIFATGEKRTALGRRVIVLKVVVSDDFDVFCKNGR
jgi:hypothetical protein